MTNFCQGYPKRVMWIVHAWALQVPAPATCGLQGGRESGNLQSTARRPALTVSETPLGLCAQLQQVRHAASSLERVAGAMARQAAADHPGRDDGVRFTVGPVDGRASRDGQGDSRRRSL
jgi:hypothetical protein